MTVPAPLPPTETERLAALRRYAILDSAPDPMLDRIVRFAAKQFKMPIALVSLVDQDRQWFQSVCGLNAKETGRDVAFCGHAILQDEVLSFQMPARTGALPRIPWLPVNRTSASTPAVPSKARAECWCRRNRARPDP